MRTGLKVLNQMNEAQVEYERKEYELGDIENSLGMLEGMREHVRVKLSKYVKEVMDSVTKNDVMNIYDINFGCVTANFTMYHNEIDAITRAIKELNIYSNHIEEEIETGGYTIDE